MSRFIFFIIFKIIVTKLYLLFMGGALVSTLKESVSEIWVIFFLNLSIITTTVNCHYADIDIFKNLETNLFFQNFYFKHNNTYSTK